MEREGGWVGEGLKESGICFMKLRGIDARHGLVTYVYTCTHIQITEL